MNRYSKNRILIILLALVVFLIGCAADDTVGSNEQPPVVENPIIEPVEEEPEEPDLEIDEDAYYTSKEEVALYLHTYNKLPGNFITKKEATNMGWDSQKGNLWDVTDKMSIGGDRFGNREKLLPEKDGRNYFECDINYEGGYRGSERLVYSNDGLIFYTSDHYESFEQLY